MRGFLLALQFLTIIPVRIKHVDAKKISASIIWFSFVGLLLGFILTAAVDLWHYLKFPALAADILTVVLLVFLTGGMHLDGLSDTFDAIFSGKNKEEMLKIMQDSHAGVMGVLAVISIILLKIAFLYSLSITLQPAALILMCTLSRWSMVLSMFIFAYAREDGKAKPYITGVNLKTLILSTFVTLIFVSVIFKTRGLLVFLLVTVCTYLTGKSFNRKIGGITGDTLGATNEIIETLILFFVCIIERSNLWII